MSLKSILVAALMMLTAPGCHCPTAKTSAPENKVEPMLGVTIEDESPTTPYIDKLLDALNKPTRSLATTSEDAPTTEALPTQPRSRTHPYRERRDGALPIQPPQSRSLTELPAPQVPEPAVTLKIVILPAVIQRVVTAPAVTASVVTPPAVIPLAATPPLATLPVATNRELPIASAPITTVAVYTTPAWPRQLGTFRLQCGHTATVWLLGPDRAVVTTEPSCSCGSFNVDVGSTPHSNARIVSTDPGEPGWTLSYCDRCGKYFLIRQ